MTDSTEQRGQLIVGTISIHDREGTTVLHLPMTAEALQRIRWELEYWNLGDGDEVPEDVRPDNPDDRAEAEQLSTVLTDNYQIQTLLLTHLDHLAEDSGGAEPLTVEQARAVVTFWKRRHDQRLYVANAGAEE